VSIESLERRESIEADLIQPNEIGSIPDDVVPEENSGEAYENVEKAELGALMQAVQLGSLAGEMLAELDNDDPMLMTDYIKQLRADVKAGERARQTLIEACLPYAEMKARHFRGCGVDHADLVQEGSIAIVKAIDTYDSSKNVPITAYVSMRIGWAMADAVRNYGDTIRVPRHNIAKVLAAREKLGITATHEQLAEEAGVSVESIPFYLDFSRVSKSLDDEIHPDYLVDRTAQSTEEAALLNIRSEVVQAALKSLSPEERELVSLRFGIGDGVERSLRELGELRGTNQVNIMRKERRILAKLRNNETLLELEGIVPEEGQEEEADTLKKLDDTPDSQPKQTRKRRPQADKTPQVDDNERDIFTLRRKMLIKVAGKKGLQAALDAETLLDGDEEDVVLYGWTEAQSQKAYLIRDKYLAKIAKIRTPAQSEL
jgi:RNA polymerase nonessential primary-like sigma factor